LILSHLHLHLFLHKKNQYVCVKNKNRRNLTVTAAAYIATQAAMPFISHSNTVTVTVTGAGLTAHVVLPATVHVPMIASTTSTGIDSIPMTIMIQKQAPPEIPSQLQPLAHQTNSPQPAPCYIQESSPPASAPSLVSLLAAAAAAAIDMDMYMHVNVNVNAHMVVENPE
jgi:hypothetical protein